MNMIPRLFAATGAVLFWAYARACRERNATQRRLSRANLHVGWQDGYPVVTCELWDDVTMDLDEATLKVISPRIEAELIRQLDDILVELRHALNGKDTDTAISIAHGIGVAAEIVASRKKLLESGQAS